MIFWRWYVVQVCDWPAAWPVRGAAAPAASPGVSAPPPADAWCTPVNQNEAKQPVSLVGHPKYNVQLYILYVVSISGFFFSGFFPVPLE